MWVQNNPKLTAFQPLMPGFMLFNMFLDFSHEHAVIVFQTHRRRLDDKSFRKLTGSVVRDRNNGCVANSRVCQKVSFKLSRRNLQTLEDDVSLFVD